MRAKKSNKNPMRILGLAVVLVLAVALVISGVSIAGLSGSATKSDDVANVALADWRDPDNTGTQSLTIPNDYITFPIGNLDELEPLDLTLPTYENFYWYTSASGKGGGESTATSISYSQYHVMADGNSIGVYAYYKLPQIFVELGATISFRIKSFTITEDKNLKTPVRGSIMLVETPSGGIAYPDPDAEKGSVEANYKNENSPAKVASDLQYLRVDFASVNQANRTSEFTVSNVVLEIIIEKIDAAPTVVSWNGSDALANVYYNNQGTANTFAQNYNIYRTGTGLVGNYGVTNTGDVPSQNKFTSLKVDGITADVTQSREKTFSFIFYDYISGLKTASLGSLNLLTRYQNEDGTPIAGNYSTVTYNRGDADITMPHGLKSVTVTPFGFVNSGTQTGIFRGLSVTAVFDGLNNSYAGVNEAQHEVDYVLYYRASCENYNGNIVNERYTAAALLVEISGIDYVKPTLPADNELTFITSNVLKENTPWFNNGDKIEYMIDIDRDWRDDVIYAYELLYSATGAANTYAAYTDYQEYDAANMTLEPHYLDDKGYYQVATLSFTAPDGGKLRNGYYKLKITATDELGREYIEKGNPAADNHTISMTQAFVVDADIPENFVWYIGTEVAVANGGTQDYLGEWTNQNISVRFNAIPTISNVKYEYRFADSTSALKNKDWYEFTSFSNLFEIYADNERYAEYDEGDPNYANYSWYSIDGFQRTYYFRATLESGKQYEISVPVKYDKSMGVTPFSSMLAKYTTDSSIQYADTLAFSFDLLYKRGNNYYESYAETSPRTLMFKIYKDGVAASSVASNALDIVNGKCTINIYDLLEIQKIALGGTQKIHIDLQFVDNAGNTSSNIQYTMTLAPASIFAKFNIDSSVIRRYNGNVNVGNQLITCQLYKSAACASTDLIAQTELTSSFAAQYNNKNAGLRNVIIKNFSISNVGTVYENCWDMYYLYVVTANGNVLVNGGTPITSAVIGTHTISPARLAIGYQMSGSKYVEITPMSFEFKGNGSYNITEPQGTDTFVCIDTIDGNDWSNVTWKASLTSGGVYYVNGVPSPRVGYFNDDITLSGTGSGNYIATSTVGTTTNLSMKVIITPKALTVGTTNTKIFKIYDGTNKATINDKHYVLNGIETGTIVYLDNSILNGIVYGSANADTYTLTVPMKLAGADAINYVLVDDLGTKLTSYEFEGTIYRRQVTVEFGDIRKTYDSTNTMTLINGTSKAVNTYVLSGVIAADKESIRLNNTNYLSADAGTSNINIAIALAGTNAGNYILVKETTESGISADADVMTQVYLEAVIEKKRVSRVDINGIYVNRGVLYEVGEDIYEKQSNNTYTKYAADGTVVRNANVDGLTLVPWVATDFLKSSTGGAIAKNQHRFEINEIVYEYVLYDTNGEVIAYADFANATEEQLIKMKPTLSTVFSFAAADSGSTTVAVTGFIAASNFIFANNATKGSVDITIIDFSSVVFAGLYNDGATNTELTRTVLLDEDNNYVLDRFGNQLYGYMYDGTNKIAKFKDGDDTIVDGISITKNGEAVTHFGVGDYEATLNYTKGENSYIATYYFRIIPITPTLTIGINDGTDFNYYENGKTEVEELSNETTLDAYNVAKYLNTNICDNVQYQYASDAAFKNVLADYPYEWGAGFYYVRAYYAGSDNGNFAEAYSPVVKFKINALPVVNDNSKDTVVYDGQQHRATFAVGSEYNKYITTGVERYFWIVYLQADGTYTTVAPKEVGSYRYELVHYGRLTQGKRGGTLNEIRDINLSNAVTGKYFGTLTIGVNKIESSNKNDNELNEQGVIEGNNKIFIPANNTHELNFYVTAYANNSGWATNFNNALHEQANALGGNYRVTTLYNTELAAEATNTGSYRVKLKATNGSGTKIIALKDGSVEEVKGVTYEGGYAVFNTDSLGWFAVADTYTPEAAPAALTPATTVGITAGSVAIVFVVITALAFLIRRKRAL